MYGKSNRTEDDRFSNGDQLSHTALHVTAGCANRQQHDADRARNSHRNPPSLDQPAGTRAYRQPQLHQNPENHGRPQNEHIRKLCRHRHPTRRPKTGRQTTCTNRNQSIRPNLRAGCKRPFELRRDTSHDPIEVSPGEIQQFLTATFH